MNLIGNGNHPGWCGDSYEKVTKIKVKNPLAPIQAMTKGTSTNSKSGSIVPSCSSTLNSDSVIPFRSNEIKEFP